MMDEFLLYFSSKAINKAYGISQVNLGFVTLKPVTDPLKIAIMSTGNDGYNLFSLFISNCVKFL